MVKLLIINFCKINVLEQSKIEKIMLIRYLIFY